MPTLADAPPALAEQRAAVETQFAALRALVRRRLLVEGLAWLIGALLLAAAISLLLDWAFRPGVGARRILGVALLAGIAAVAWRKLLQPLLAPLDPPRLATALRRRSPAAAERVAAVLGLPAELERNDHFSPALVDAAVRQSAAALRDEDFRQHLDGQRHAQRWLAAAGFAALAAGVAFEFPHAARTWWRRWVEGSTVRWPQRNMLALEGLGPDGVLRTPRDEPHPLRVGAAPAFEPVGDDWRVVGSDRVFAYPPGQPPRVVPPGFVRMTVEAADAPTARGVLSKASDTLFQGELPPLRGNAKLWLEGGDERLGPTPVEPVDRPVFRKFTATAVPPGQTAPQTVDAFSGQMLYLRDTQVTLRVEADQPLAAIDSKVDAGANGSWTRVGPDAFEASFKVKESQTWEVRLKPQGHPYESKPARVATTLLVDRAPRAELAAKGVGRRITSVARVPLTVRMEDDLGLAAATLETETAIPAGEKPKLSKSRAALPLPKDARPKRFDHAEEYKAAPLKLPPGSTLTLKAAAEDACAQGKQVGESRALAFQIVTPEELFYEILTRQRAERTRFQAAWQKLDAEAGKLDAAKDGEPFRAAQRLADVTDREVWRMAGRLEAALLEMRLNELGTPAALDLMETSIVQPMKALHEPLLPALAGQLRMAANDPKAQPDARKAQRDAAAEMKRILDRMAQWEGFVDVVNQLKAIRQLEAGVLERTEKSNGQTPAGVPPKPKNPDDIFDK